MSADFSKVRFNPLLNHAGVQLQQGRVLLDADFNELTSLLDRRLRALAGDVLGRATVGANTPDAFRITLVNGVPQIGRGRLYVDGLLAENHGSGAPAYDALMGGPTFSTATPITAQPYLPINPQLPTTGLHCIYLDVWERVVTHLEDPGLVETAVGVDATTRTQTVWQVRVLAESAPAGTDCATPDAAVPGWAAVTAPSTGRLTTGSFEVAPGADPCELPPEGGYRGLENQLYRVQIHDAGAPGGTATFKWSRENASVGSRVTRFLSNTEVELESLGRDDVLRFNTGDWAEFIDDEREFSLAPGELRRVTVHDDRRSLEFTGALGALQPANSGDAGVIAPRNLRVRRWDHKGRVLRVQGNTTVLWHDLDAPGATGAIPVPSSGTLLLEDGITVSFTAQGDPGFRSGDFWCFAARTLDASVEDLTNAPPLGTQHHQARLGFWNVPAGTVSDCRHGWPPQGDGDCACTECVTPASHASGQLTIQAAVDRVATRGGTVCLQAGSYELDAPVRIRSARSLRIVGQGPATLIGSAGAAFEVASSFSVEITDLAVLATGSRGVAGAAVQAANVIGLKLQNLALLVAGDGGVALTLAGVVAGLTMRDNLLVAETGVLANTTAGTRDGVAQQRRFLFTASVRLQDNIFWCRERGVHLTGLTGHLYATLIEGNEFLLCRNGALTLAGFALPGAAVQVQHNVMATTGPGIACAVDGALIEGNKLRAMAQGTTPPLGAGITLTTGLDPNGSDQCQVIANQVSGYPEAGILIEAPTRSLIVKLNIVERCGNGILMLDDAAAGSASIENNHLHDLGAVQAGNARSITVVGIAVLRTQTASLVGNTIQRVGTTPVARTRLIAGILGQGVGQARVHGNSLAAIGPAGEFNGSVGGVLWRGPYDELDVSHNDIRRDEDPVTAPGSTEWLGVEVTQPDSTRPTLSASGYTAMRMDNTRTLVLNNNRVTVATSRVGVRGLADADGGSSLGLKGNVVLARGTGRAVQVQSSADLMFCDNRCELNALRVNGAVVLASGAVIASANRITGGTRSLVLAAPAARVTAIGNITSAGIAMAAGNLPQQWLPLNVTA
jgi:Family of unknown function (DUF6519)